MLFILLTPVLIRQLWQLKTVVFLHYVLLYGDNGYVHKVLLYFPNGKEATVNRALDGSTYPG